MRIKHRLQQLVFLYIAMFAMPLFAQNTVTAGAIIVEPPTLIALGFEWPITGDDNRNASVEVDYRKAGESQWQAGLPLLRMGGEYVQQWDSVMVTVPNMFSGSVFDLEEDTDYEVRFTLNDPDGINGQISHTIQARTKAEPQSYTNGRVFHVYPTDYDGEMEQPGFHGLLEAYYTGARSGDWSNTAPPRVEPGDTILVHAGTYQDIQEYYSHELISNGRSCCTTTWDGTYYLTESGTAEKPIAIKAAGDGEVIFDGNDNEVLFNVMAADYLYFEGITFRNTRHAILAGRKNIAGSVGLVVKNSRFEDVGIGIHTDYSGSAAYYIADNFFVGRHYPDELISWLPEIWNGVEQPFIGIENYADKSKMRSYYAIKLYGAGHIIAYNDVRHFHDGINHATYGTPDDWPNTPRDRMAVAIDIYNNDISNMHDNCIETDGALYNIRVLRNRCFNSATGAMSFQPVMGGPVYFIRNVVYHAVGGILKSQANPAGILHYNNTYIGGIWHLTPASNLHYRNNLIIGQQRRSTFFTMDSNTPYSSSDYNGFRPNTGEDVSFIRISSDQASPDLPRIERGFSTLAEYASATGQDSHSIVVDYDVFQSVQMPDLNEASRIYFPDEVDFRLQANGAAIDAGVFLPQVNDGFSGAAPDLGAYESGQALPHYGPRN